VSSINFIEIAVSVERHGTLYQCLSCKAFIEVIAEERTPRFISESERQLLYPSLNVE
jgi:hypothetical protein